MWTAISGILNHGFAGRWRLGGLLPAVNEDEAVTKGQLDSLSSVGGATFSGGVMTGDVDGDLTGNTDGTHTGPVVFFVASSAELIDEAHALNTTGKGQGKTVWNSTDTMLYTATGSGVNDDWAASDGTTTITPAP